MKIKQDVKELAHEVFKLNDYINENYKIELLPLLPKNSSEEVTDFAVKIKFKNKIIGAIQTVNEEYFKFKELEKFEPYDSPLTYNGDFELERKISLKDNKKEFTLVMVNQLLHTVENHEKEMLKEDKYKLFTKAFEEEISSKKNFQKSKKN